MNNIDMQQIVLYNYLLKFIKIFAVLKSAFDFIEHNLDHPNKYLHPASSLRT